MSDPRRWRIFLVGYQTDIQGKTEPGLNELAIRPLMEQDDGEKIVERLMARPD
jgi:hypothetical protein